MHAAGTCVCAGVCVQNSSWQPRKPSKRPGRTALGAMAQGSASAPLLQSVQKAVRVSVIAMGAAPLAPKEAEPAAVPSILKDEKVHRFNCVLLE